MTLALETRKPAGSPAPPRCSPKLWNAPSGISMEGVVGAASEAITAPQEDVVMKESNEEVEKEEGATANAPEPEEGESPRGRPSTREPVRCINPAAGESLNCVFLCIYFYGIYY